MKTVTSPFTHAIDYLTPSSKVHEVLDQAHDKNMIIDKDVTHIFLMGETDYICTANGPLEAQEPGVEYAMANRFLKNINVAMRANENPILVHMKTDGGDWQEGMAIYDAIKACPNEITILNYTYASSMSSLIFQAADKRVMMPHSIFMFHMGTNSISGTVKQVNNEVEFGKLLDEQMMSIYINKLKEKGKLSKWSKKRIREWLVRQMDKKEDVFMLAGEAVDYGFADEVFGADGVYDWASLIKYED